MNFRREHFHKAVHRRQFIANSLQSVIEELQIQTLLGDLGRLYREHPCLWQNDREAASFAWVDCSDRAQSVVSFLRSDDSETLLVTLNATPVPRDDYRVGVPTPGPWRLRLSTDATTYGGSGYTMDEVFWSEATPYHGQSHSIALPLPPLAGLVLSLGD